MEPKEIKQIMAAEVNGVIVIARPVGYAGVVEAYYIGREVERQYFRGDNRAHTDQLTMLGFERLTGMLSRLDDDDLRGFVSPTIND